MTELHLGGVILAAGASRRMGEPKQLLEHGGKPLLQHTLEAVRGAMPDAPVVTVLGAHADSIKAVLGSKLNDAVVNKNWKEGLSTSLKCGLGFLRERHPNLDGVLFSLADQPRLRSQLLRSLIDAAAANPDARVAAARYDGHLGAPCILSASGFAQVDQIRGDQGLRALFGTLDPTQVAPVDLPELALDVDTPAEWEQFRSTTPEAD